MLPDCLRLPLPIMEKKPLVAQTTRLMLTLPVLLRTPVGETKIPLPMMQPTMTLTLLLIPPTPWLCFTVHPLRRVISAFSPTDFSPSSGSSSIFSLVSLDKLVVSTSSVHYTLSYLSGVYSLPCTSRGCWVLLPPSRASLLSLPIFKLSPFLNSISFLLSHSTMVFWLFCFSCMLSSLWPRYVPEYLHLGPATTVQPNVPSPLPPGPWLRLLLARTGEAEDELRLTKEAASADPDWARRISGGLCKLAKMTEWPSACHALGPLSCPG